MINSPIRTNAAFPNDVMAADILDLLVAGHETSSYSLTFALYYLSLNLEWQKKLQDEADSFSLNPSYEDVAKMKVANAIVRESLRIIPVVPLLFRKCKAPTEVKGIKVNPEVMSLN
jgi:cytochrome P450